VETSSRREGDKTTGHEGKEEYTKSWRGVNMEAKAGHDDLGCSQ
jgi:hypothetical protein